jgi:OOP family OmpA-OmpF porin
MSALKLFFLSIASLALVACDHMNITKLDNRTITGSDYRSHLASKYKEVVKYEALEMVDLPDAAHFATKAIAVLDNKEVPGPEKLENWHVHDDFKKDLTTASRRLETALKIGIKETMPEMAAEAVVGFDCWMEQAEEGWQVDHIKLCRDRFNIAMDGIQEKVGLTITDEANAERKIVIYYDHDSSKISANDQAYLSAEVTRIPMHHKVSLLVTGHADRKGPESYNQNLSLQRAIGIHKALSNFGIGKK